MGLDKERRHKGEEARQEGRKRGLGEELETEVEDRLNKVERRQDVKKIQQEGQEGGLGEDLEVEVEDRLDNVEGVQEVHKVERVERVEGMYEMPNRTTYDFQL